MGQSPCPKYFRYYQDVFNNEIIGIVEIPSPPKGVPLMLRVTLSVPVPLSEVRKNLEKNLNRNTKFNELNNNKLIKMI